MSDALHVQSEIARLKTVLLHRPGVELMNLTPELLKPLLFDDIPFLEDAQREHDQFADALRAAGVEVLYLEQLLLEMLQQKPAVQEPLLQEWLTEACVVNLHARDLVLDFLHAKTPQELLSYLIGGMRKTVLPAYRATSLEDFINGDYPLLVDPMPNLYFTRDPFAVIGRGVSLHHMHTHTRRRETLFARYIFRHHPRFAQTLIPYWTTREENTSIEGGDILVLNAHTVAIGVSQRTEAASVEKLALRLLSDEHSSFQEVLAFQIPKSRAFMHLDTVFTQVDKALFTMHPEVREPLHVYRLCLKDAQSLSIEAVGLPLERILSEVMGQSVTLLQCGAGDPIDAAREQWNDASNTLAIAPGEVVVYARNTVTNQLLEEHGVKLCVIPSAELSRGRGGPRCMSMPLVREA